MCSRFKITWRSFFVVILDSNWLAVKILAFQLTSIRGLWLFFFYKWFTILSPWQYPKFSVKITPTLTWDLCAEIRHVCRFFCIVPRPLQELRQNFLVFSFITYTAQSIESNEYLYLTDLDDAKLSRIFCACKCDTKWKGFSLFVGPLDGRTSETLHKICHAWRVYKNFSCYSLLHLWLSQ